MPGTLQISPVQCRTTSPSSRVAAIVGDSEVWFESDDVALRPSVEAFVSAFLIPSVAARLRLDATGPVDAAFAASMSTVLDIAHRWWGYDPMLPRLDTRCVDRDPQSPAAGRTALCFSGGVDSFHTLLASGRKIDDLVFVRGFDMPLADVARAEAVEEQVREIAGVVGARAIIVRTNLRAHPPFRAARWDRTHGGALAAVGHLLAGHADTLLISASFSHKGWHPWGSAWQLDPLWSGNGLTVEHIGAELNRAEKLRVLRDEPLVRRHLRVCWENRTEALNCSRCEKCIRNQVVLGGLGVLEHFRVFEPPATLAARVDQVARIRDPQVFARYEFALAMGGLTPQAALAVRALLARSKRAMWRDRVARAHEYLGAVARRVMRGRRLDASSPRAE
ncbi:MAG TPA: hypothetical protein VN607_06085 [Gemmatimonadaceae bacterium]|nr:hypothetical protein [Gemmatimonadaceae bacterium]